MQNQTVNTLKLLWFGFTGAVMVYIFVAYQTSQQKGFLDKVGQSTIPNLLWILMALAAMSLVLAHVVFPRIIERSKPEISQPDSLTQTHQQPAAPNPLKIMQFAFSEAIAIYGLVYFFTAGDMKIFLGFCAVAIFSLLAIYPRE